MWAARVVELRPADYIVDRKIHGSGWLQSDPSMSAEITTPVVTASAVNLDGGLAANHQVGVLPADAQLTAHQSALE